MKGCIHLNLNVVSFNISSRNIAENFSPGPLLIWVWFFEVFLQCLTELFVPENTAKNAMIMLAIYILDLISTEQE